MSAYELSSTIVEPVLPIVQQDRHDDFPEQIKSVHENMVASKGLTGATYIRKKSGKLHCIDRFLRSDMLSPVCNFSKHFKFGAILVDGYEKAFLRCFWCIAILKTGILWTNPLP